MSDMEIRTREQATKPSSLDEDKRQATFTVSTERAVMTRAGLEVLRSKGCKLGRYLKNPTVLNAHDRSTVEAILGSAVEVKIVGRRVDAVVRFADTDAGENAWQLTKSGHLRAASVGYAVNPKKSRWLREGESEGDVEGPAVIVDEWTLLEISLVPVPADEDTLARGLTKGGSMNYSEVTDEGRSPEWAAQEIERRRRVANAQRIELITPSWLPELGRQIKDDVLAGRLDFETARQQIREAARSRNGAPAAPKPKGLRVEDVTDEDLVRGLTGDLPEEAHSGVEGDEPSSGTREITDVNGRPIPHPKTGLPVSDDDLIRTFETLES